MNGQTASTLRHTRERFVPELDADQPYAASHLARYAWACSRLEPSDSVLDLACGSGYGTHLLAQHCASAFGVDRCEPAVEFARRSGRSVRFTVGDFFDAPADCALVDVVVSFETIEHIAAPLPQALERLIASTRRLLIGSVPFREPPGNPFHCHFWLGAADLAPLANYGRLECFYQLPGGRIVHRPDPSAENLLFVLERHQPGSGWHGESASEIGETSAHPVPRVAILVPGTADAHRLTVTLDSLVNQSRADWEVLVADSHLDSAVRQTLSRYAARDRRIRCAPDPAASIGEWLESARRRTAAEWLVVWPSDAWSEPAALGRIVNAIDAHPWATVIRAPMAWFDEPTSTMVRPDVPQSSSDEAHLRGLLDGHGARTVCVVAAGRVDGMGGFEREPDVDPVRNLLLHLALLDSPVWLPATVGVERLRPATSQATVSATRLPVRPRPTAAAAASGVLRPSLGAAVRQRLTAGRATYVWGAGSRGRLAAAACADLVLRGFIDSDRTSHGRTIDSLPVHPPDVLGLFDDEKPFVIVASVHEIDIARALAIRGFRAGIDFALFDPELVP